MQKCSLIVNVWANRSRLSVNTIAKFSSSKCKKSEVTARESEKHETRSDVNEEKLSRRDYRFIFPEFLPDPNIKFRNSLAEKLQRNDLLARRNRVEIPGIYQVQHPAHFHLNISEIEFYVGSIMAVTVSDSCSPHPNKLSRFVGICIGKR